MEPRWRYRIGSALAIAGVALTACRAEANDHAVARPMNTATIPFSTPESAVETEVGAASLAPPTREATASQGAMEPVATEAFIFETETPMSSGEIFVGELVYGEDIEEIERLGQTRFRVVFGTGDSYYFIDESGQGIPPADFDRQRYLHFIGEAGLVYDLPLYLQHDPRWGLQSLGSSQRFLFGRRGCGQAVAATVAALAGMEVDPLRFSQVFIPGLGWGNRNALLCVPRYFREFGSCG